LYPVVVSGLSNVIAVAGGNGHTLALTKPSNTEEPLSIITSSLTDGVVGVRNFYNQTLAASGGTPPYTWTLLSGSLPGSASPIQLNSSGIISGGGPDTAGTFNFTVKVTDSKGATATKDLTITVNAQSSTQPSITVTKYGAGSGTVTSSPTGISCGTTCNSSFTSGTQITLQATPYDSNSTFAGWTGSCTGTGSCTIPNINADTQIYAKFDKTDNQPPVAQFTASPVSGVVPLQVNFTDQSLRADAWSWSLGDGTVVPIANPSHTYTTPGIYDVSLTVTNAVGESDTINKTSLITVTTSPVTGGVRILRNPPETFSSLQTAFDAVQDGETMQCQATSFTEDINLNRSVRVTLDGGYDSGFSTHVGVTSIFGSLTISDGSITVDGLVIR